MAYWTDYLNPVQATGYLRAALADKDVAPNTFADLLPNQFYQSDVVRMTIRDRGNAPVAFWRSRDAEPEEIGAAGGRELTMSMRNLSAQITLTETDRLRLQRAGAPAIIKSVQDYIDDVASSIHNSVVVARANTLLTGRFQITQHNYVTTDNFGRAAGNEFAIGTGLWTDPDVDRAAGLRGVVSMYKALNGMSPGKLIMRSAVWETLMQGSQFRSSFGNAVGSIPMNPEQVRAYLVANDLPPVVVNDAQFAGQYLLPADKILVVPPAGSGLGATYWGPTLASGDPAFSALGADAPGAVIGLIKSEGVNSNLRAQADALVAPALANPNQTMVVKVK